MEHAVVSQLDLLAGRLPLTMLRDRERLRGRLNAIHRRAVANQPFDQQLEKLSFEFDEAAARLAERQSHVPTPNYDDALPIVQKRQEIADAIRENQIVVICGETGSGKTTQLPKICLELGRGVAGLIGHTQPRRIAARSVATRIAEELQTPLGEVVGYQVRFTDKRSPRTLVKLMTDGILLAETQNDPRLLDYDTIIIDEAHERSLNIDFLLGYLKQLLPKRPDLKVIVTSATIDPQRFSKHFDNCPIVMVSGRTYPVEVRYRALQASDPNEEDLLMEEAVVAATDELWQTAGPGDTLVFCSGEREIRELAELLRKHHPPATEILPLFARLSSDEQMRVFSPHQKRRIILATNVAETSLTVPGIRYVIDTGLARMSRYAPKTKVQRLPIEPISRASADQRKGRCGRVAEGICVRLYSEDDFQRRAEFTEPQILRTNLAAVILQMKALRLGDIGDFPFIDPPDARAIRDGYHTLHELGAIDQANELTELGRLLARLPIDPRVGRMVLAAKDEGVADDVLIIAAALSVQEPRERPSDKQQAADAAHGKFRDEQSDFVSYIKLWEWFHDSKKHLSGSQLRRACKENFLSFIRMREWIDIHSQLNEIVGEMGFKKQSPPMQRNDAIHRALLSGLLGNIGMKSESFEYMGARNTKFHIFPGSTLFSRKPPWIMAAEIVETTKLYARTNASIKPEWIERAAPHLLKKTYSDPHWQAHSGHVMAYEKVALYGLPIVPRRSVHYGPIDPKVSRHMFIQHALVDGDWFTNARFFRHNRELIEQVQMIESKARKRDLLVDVQAQFDFYDKRIPATVYNAPLFEKWRRQAEAQAADVLLMKPADLMNYDAEVGFEQFPDTLVVNGMVLPLTYHLDPGSSDDGVTVALPLAAVNQFAPAPFEWLVPGLLKEKVIALIRSLQKQLRTQFVPVPEFAAALLPTLHGKAPSLMDALALHLSKSSNQSITRYDFQLDTLPDHLRMNFRVVDEHGKAIAEGRDLVELQQKVGGKATAIFTDNAEKDFHRDGIISWDFGRLPQQVELHRHGMTLQAFPAIVDQTQSVGLRLLDTRAAADIATRGGVRRLFILQLDKQINALMRQLPIDDLCLCFARLGDGETLRANLVLAAADAVLSDPTTVRSREDFIERADAAWRDLPGKLDQFVAATRDTLREWQQVQLQLEAPPPPLLVPPINDIRQQLAALVNRSFLLTTPPAWLPHLPRFVRGAGIRLKKLFNAGFARDAANVEQLSPIFKKYLEYKAEHARRQLTDPNLTQLRWMIEEFRVSLFAQELKTSIPISAARLNRQIELVVR